MSPVMIPDVDIAGLRSLLEDAVREGTAEIRAERDRLRAEVERLTREREALLAPKTARDRMFDSEAWDAAMDALGKMRERAEKAEAERDAAIRERDGLIRTRIDRAECCAQVEAERDEAIRRLKECGRWVEKSEALAARLEGARGLLCSVSEESMGGTPDLFWPDGGWEKFWTALAAWLAAGTKAGEGP